MGGGPGQTPSVVVAERGTLAQFVRESWPILAILMLILAMGAAMYLVGRWTQRNETVPESPPERRMVAEAPGPDNTIVTMPPPVPPGTPSPDPEPERE